MSHNHRRPFAPVPSRPESRAQQNTTAAPANFSAAHGSTPMMQGAPQAQTRALDLSKLAPASRKNGAQVVRPASSAGAEGRGGAIGMPMRTRQSFDAPSRPRTAFAPTLGAADRDGTFGARVDSPQPWPSNQLQLAAPRPSPPGAVFMPTGLLSASPGVNRREFKAPAPPGAMIGAHTRTPDTAEHGENAFAHHIPSPPMNWDRSPSMDEALVRGTKRPAFEDMYAGDLKRFKADMGPIVDGHNASRHTTPGILRDHSFAPNSDGDVFSDTPGKAPHQFLSPISMHTSNIHHGREEQQELSPPEGVVLRIGAFAQYAEENHDVIVRTRKRWSECTMDEWRAGSDDIIAMFTQVFDMGKELMQSRIQLYQKLADRIDKQRTELGNREALLKVVTSQTVRGGGSVLSGDLDPPKDEAESG